MMVSQYDSERLLATMQTDHSRVAGFLAAHWGNEMFAAPRPWNSVVVAAQEHDRGWWLWESKPTLNDQGKALDYHDRTLHFLGQLRLDMYRMGVNDTLLVDPYAGVLVLNHLSGLLNAGNGHYSFRKDFSSTPMVRTFLDEQIVLQEKTLEVLRNDSKTAEYCTDENLETNYKLLEIIDQLAQFVCNRYPLNNGYRGDDVNKLLTEFSVPTSPGSEDVNLRLTVLDETHLGIDPFPFDATVSVSFVSRLLPNKSYENQQSFLREFYGAETVAVNYELVPA